MAAWRPEPQTAPRCSHDFGSRYTKRLHMRVGVEAGARRERWEVGKRQQHKKKKKKVVKMITQNVIIQN